MAKRAMTFKRLAELMTEKTGKKYTLNGLSSKLRLESITLKEAVEVLDILGYHFDIEENK